MKVLMFGWEFPPHISGGLGTACLGLTSSLVQKNVSVLFVVPKAYGDEPNEIKLINASTVPLRYERVNTTHHLQPAAFTNYPERFTTEKVDITLDPYKGATHSQTLNTLEQWNYILPEGRDIFSTTRVGIGFSFSGTYGPNLLEEVERYADVASIIAHKNKFDIIHAHDWMTFKAGLAARGVSRKPLIVHVHATEVDRAGEHHVDTRVFELEREGMANADRVVAVSEWTKGIIHKHYGIPLRKIKVVHNGVTPYKNGKASHLPPIGSKVVTFLGRITHQKGPHYFIEAARKVLDQFSDTHFIIGGSGDLMPKMIERVAQLRLSDHFHFTGFLHKDQMNTVWSMSSVYVMPSVSEPFGITPLEALQAGVPVIISNQSGVSEVLPQAIKVDFWNTDALADAICGILKYPTLATALNTKSEELIKRLSWDKATGILKKLYDELAKEKVD